MTPFRATVLAHANKRGVTQSDLARAIGVSPSLLSRLLDQRRPLRAHHLEHLARALELDPSELNAPPVEDYVSPVYAAAAPAVAQLNAQRAAARGAGYALVAGLRAEADSLRASVAAQTDRAAAAEARAERLAAELAAQRARHEAERNAWKKEAP